MMFVAALRALPITLVIFVLETLISVVLVLPFSAEASHMTRGPLDASARAALLDAMTASSSLWRVLSMQTLMVFGLWVLLSPWLNMAWLSALSAPTRPGRALSLGMALLRRALGVSLM